MNMNMQMNIDINMNNNILQNSELLSYTFLQSDPGALRVTPTASLSPPLPCLLQFLQRSKVSHRQQLLEPIFPSVREIYP